MLTPPPLPSRNRGEEATPPLAPPPRDTSFPPSAGHGPAGDGRAGAGAGAAEGDHAPDWADEAAAAVADAEGQAGPLAGALLYVAARLSDDRLQDQAAAVDHLQEALVRAGGGAPLDLVVRGLRELALESGAVLAAIEALDRELGAATRTDRRADLLAEKAYLYADHLLVTAPALAAAEEALRLHPGHRGALTIVQTLAERADDGAALWGALERRQAAASTGAERARVLTRLGLVAEADPARLAQALDCFVRALDEDPRGDAGAVARAGLRRVAGRLGRGAELLRGIAAEAEALGAGPLHAAWLGAAAAVSRYRLGAGERAAAIVEQALADDPSDLALLAASAEDHLVAGRWRKAIELFDRQADLVGDQDYASALQVLAAHVAEQQLSDDDGASRRYRRVLAVRPSDPVALAAMERIASKSGDVALQIELISASVGRAEDPAERAALAVRVAELNEMGLADLDSAATFARRALDAIPGYGPAIHTLDRLYARLGRWSDMLRVIEADAANEAPDGAASIGGADDIEARRLERLGGVYESGLGDAGKALEVYGQWVALGVHRRAALQALLRAAEKAGDSLVAAEAAMKLGTEIPELSEAQRIAWRYRAATLYEERAAADAEAITAFESVLDLAPRFRPAFAGLARAHRRSRNWAALADVLSRRASCELSGTRGAALEVEAARVYAERLAAPDEALAALDRALGFEAGSLAALDYRWRLLTRAGRMEEAAAALGALAERLGDPAARAATLRRQAELLEWPLKRPREALVAVERALGVGRVPGIQAAELAHERLLELVGRVGDAAAFQHARLPPSPQQRGGPGAGAAGATGGIGATGTTGDGTVGGVGRRLDLAIRLPDREEGLRLVGQVVEGAPADLFAVELLAWQAHRLGNDAAAAAALERLGEGAREPPARVALLRAAIGARARGGAEHAAGFGLYQRIAEVDPASDALATLERLATRRGDWPKVVASRRGLVETAADDRARALRLWELADARAEVGDRKGAIADLERARELGPDLPPLLRALGRLHLGVGAVRSAAEAYLEVGRATRTPARAAAALRQAARLYAETVRDDDAAARVLENLLLLEPGAEVDFQVLEVILKSRGETDRLVEVARKRTADATAQPQERRDRLTHLAELLRELRPAEAVEPLQQAVALDPTFVPALSALAELLAELGRAAEAVATFRRVVAAAADGRTVAGAWSRIGEIAAGPLGDGVTAIAAYRSALIARPDDVAALSGLTQALLRQRDYTGAAQALRRLAAVDPDREARVGHWISLGEVQAGPGRDPEAAAEALEKALELDPASGGAIDRLDGVLSELDDPHRLARALGLHLEAAPADVQRRLRLARLLRGPLSSPEQGADELRTVVKQMPGDVGLRAELAAALEDASKAREAAVEHLAVLRIEPLRLESLRSLRRLHERLVEPRRSAVVNAVLVAIGAAEPEDARALREARARGAIEEPRGNISAGEFETVVRHPAERHPATGLLATLVEVIPRLYPVSLEDWGVGRADRVGPRSDEPVRPLVKRLGALFGIEEEFEIYQARTGLAQVELEPTFPPALLVPANLMTSTPRHEAVLQLGRQLGRLRGGTYLAARLSARELGVVLAAALRSRYPEYGRGLAAEDSLSELTQRVGRLVPRRHRRAFDKAVVDVAEAGPLDVSRWRQGMVHTAHRTAVLASNDVLGCLEQVIRADRRLAAAAAVSASELLGVAHESPEIVELVSFVLGDEFAALRERIA